MTDTIPESIRLIAQNLRTQDNHITANPIFVVQQKKRIPLGDDDSYGENYTWRNRDWEQVDEEKAAELDALDIDHLDIPKGYTKVYHLDIWENVQPFLTDAGAKAYLHINSHNLKQPRIFVDSGWRNFEWEEVREFLKTL